MTSCKTSSELKILLPMGHHWRKVPTRLTYNCAHLRSTKESLTDSEKKFFVRKFFCVKIFLGENLLGEHFLSEHFFLLKFFLFFKIYSIIFDLLPELSTLQEKSCRGEVLKGPWVSDYEEGSKNSKPFLCESIFPDVARIRLVNVGWIRPLKKLSFLIA